MGWKNLGEKPVVETPWFRLNLADVELPGGRRVDHDVLRLHITGRCRAAHHDLVVHNVDPPAGGEPDQFRAHQPVADRVCPPEAALASVERQQQQILAKPVDALTVRAHLRSGCL